MRKRLSVLMLAAAISIGLTFGGIAYAQPPQVPTGTHFPGDHVAKPDMQGPDGGNFKRPGGRHPGQEMRDNLRKDKKDFQDRLDKGKKDFKGKMKKERKSHKRGNGKDFRPGEHREGPDFGKPDQNFRPGDHRAPDFGQPRK